MSKLFNMSDAASIALHAMVLVAKSASSINVIQISEATKTSKHHVAKVMQRLVKDSFIQSQREFTGGFKLRGKPEEISFLDIYESIEGKTTLPDCMMNVQQCPLDHCIMNNITQKMSKEFIDYLKSQNLAMYL